MRIVFALALLISLSASRAFALDEFPPVDSQPQIPVFPPELTPTEVMESVFTDDVRAFILVGGVGLLVLMLAVKLMRGLGRHSADGSTWRAEGFERRRQRHIDESIPF